tara:strand:- start:223855 stop:224958 length:1104 start_codon:yes stop_codon:yes gene_type:complete
MAASSNALILMMAGGTGGHVYPALAVARELLERGYRVQWVGTKRGLEHRVVPAAGIQLHCLAVRGVRGKSLFHTVLGMLALAWASLQALWLVMRLSPSVVVGMGGYAAGPAGLAAWLLRKPLLIHEQNAVAGTTNRLLAPLARKVVGGFTAPFGDKIDVLALGNPVRRELIETAAHTDYEFDGTRPLRLLVLGGSLGARPINQLVPGAVERVRQAAQGRLQVWHQSGVDHIDDVRSAYGDVAPGEVQVMPFIVDMAAAYSWADLVLCRAGALTLAELAIMGRPSLLVPLPQAIDDHQNANARSLTACGAAQLLPQTDLTAEVLSVTLLDYLQHPARLTAMASAARMAGKPQATQAVADCCEELLHGR